VSTNKPALYAFDAATGAFLWSADGLPASPQNGVNDSPMLGPAVYGNYVVIGCLGNVYIYTLEPSVNGPGSQGGSGGMNEPCIRLGEQIGALANELIRAQGNPPQPQSVTQQLEQKLATLQALYARECMGQGQQGGPPRQP
jgi:hypothetical protein